MKRTVAPIALALATSVLAASASLAAPTSASAAASIDRTTYLNFPSKRQLNICTNVRRIRLRGTYRFGVYLAHWAHPHHRFGTSRRLRLHGVYRWYVCRFNLYPGYWVHAHVENVATGGQASVSFDKFAWPYGDGSYTWGSTIANVRARR